MLFNTLSFAFFLPIVFLFYWFVVKNNLRLQNLFLLLSSYFFYSCWDWRFLFLLIFSTLLDYFTGLRMTESKNPNSKKFWFWLSVIINLGFLSVFKYYNFFVDSFAAALALLGLQVNISTLTLILPVGISFYTFHGLSYVIDIYKDRIKAEKNFIDYSLFVSFFPLLVAGPIERATHLLPQIKSKREFDYSKATDGLRQILWGLFKKIVIADQCAEFANQIFNHSDSYSGVILVFGAIFFTFQIYGDFSGYSDIAIGTAKLFGIDLLRNFAFPYFSRDIAEFWRRWHISLSTWFRDYLYIPLGGSNGTSWLKIRNVFVIFLVSGLWHGANWTFIFWGFLNALFILPSIIFNTNRNNMLIVAQGKLLPSIRDFFSILLTFSMTVFAWIFFRSKNLDHAFQYVAGIFNNYQSFFILSNYTNYISQIISILLFLSIEWFGREGQYGIANIGLTWRRPMRYAFYYLIILSIFWFGADGPKQEFIYFQF